MGSAAAASLSEPRNGLRHWLAEPLAHGIRGAELAQRGVAI